MPHDAPFEYEVAGWPYMQGPNTCDMAIIPAAKKATGCFLGRAEPRKDGDDSHRVFTQPRPKAVRRLTGHGLRLGSGSGHQI